jgi:hypothetical protein
VCATNHAQRVRKEGSAKKESVLSTMAATLFAIAHEGGKGRTALSKFKLARFLIKNSKVALICKLYRPDILRPLFLQTPIHPLVLQITYWFHL